jgi:hypothetical protein
MCPGPWLGAEGKAEGVRVLQSFPEGAPDVLQVPIFSRESHSLDNGIGKV